MVFGLIYVLYRPLINNVENPLFQSGFSESSGSGPVCSNVKL
jgi:hypothetical protein